MSEDQIKQVADVLKTLPAGKLPYPIFEQIARIVALPIIEFIPLRLRPEGQVEVLLLKRPADDPLFPGMLHTPGTVVRADDEPKGQPHPQTAFDRLFQDELGSVESTAPHYVGSIFHTSKRGTEQAQLFWVEILADKPPVGEFWPLDKLPGSLIDSQRTFIQRAAEDFMRAKSVG